jgi:hypothetical protein
MYLSQQENVNNKGISNMEKRFISMKYKKAIFKFTQNIPEREIIIAQVLS